MSKESNVIKVLIVDDSVIYRSQIKLALKEIEGVEVVGVCSNGQIALNKLALGGVDLLILDLEMPVLNGLETLNNHQLKTGGIKNRLKSGGFRPKGLFG